VLDIASNYTIVDMILVSASEKILEHNRFETGLTWEPEEAI